jgi:UDP-N-acetylmuramoyl-L-alanyl-D-glutamate--2,6-diaminopimelate ligase
MKDLIKKIIPRDWLLQYHKFWAVLANFIYGFPSKDLIVIGVTGTNGKSTTCNLIAKVLEQSGVKVGLMTTANFKIGDEEWLNPTHQTMQGRLDTQKMIREMVSAGCQYAVLETSSEGILQYRHWGIRYDVAVMTNLTPEHIEAHGSFEKYKQDKGRLFAALAKYPKKKNNNKEIDKAIVVNLDDENWQYYLNYQADQKYAYGLQEYGFLENVKYIKPKNYKLLADQIIFVLKDVDFTVNLIGKFNIYNCLAAVCVGLHFGLSIEQCRDGLAKVKGIPGRMELIKEGQNFTVLIDYAHDAQSFEILFNTLKIFDKNRIIHVFGSAGGVRDHSKRPNLGSLSAQNTDITIITDEDSYDEPVSKILNEIAQGAKDNGKKEGEDLFLIEDRKEAIKKACQLAQAGDLVLITGKGTEQSIKSGGTVTPWDDRKVTREVLQEIL